MNEHYTSGVMTMASSDKTSFDIIHNKTGLSEKEVITLIQRTLKLLGFRLWIIRVFGRNQIHSKKHRAQA